MSELENHLRVDIVPIDSVFPDPANSRVHPQHNLDVIKGSLARFGLQKPIVVDRNNVIRAGNGTWRAAKELGWKEIAVVRSSLSMSDASAYAAVDNRSAELAEWDPDMLQAQIDGLLEDGWSDADLSSMGIGTNDITDILSGIQNLPDTTETTEDVAPPIQEKAVSRTGDLWTIGRHRLLCGDSTKVADVARVMNGERGVLMNTDPPYGIGYVSNAHSKGQAVGFNDIESDETDGPKLQAFLETIIRTATTYLIPTAAFYLWHPMLTQGTFFAAAAAAADILIHRQIIWVKPSLVFGRGDYHWRHELCFYGWRRGSRPAFYGERNQTTVWEINRESNGSHPTQKPVELFAIPMRNHTREGEICYEPFAGSGSQFIAAEQLGRRCYGIEIEPLYVDVVVRRWQNLIGKDAVLDGEEKSFAEIAEDRRS